VKRLLYGLGATLAVLSVLYVLYQAYDERIWEVKAEVLHRLGATLAVGIVVYAISSILLAVAWHATLAWTGEHPRSIPLSIGIYGRAQIAKYAPGNVFSFVGRQMLGRQAGYSHKALAWASLFEVFGMLYATGLLACIGASEWISSLLGIPRTVFFLAVAALALAPPVALILFQSTPWTRRFALHPRSVADYARLNLVFLIYVPFFLTSGLLFAMLLWAASPSTNIEWLQIAGAVSAIWLVGYVTPGASAGIGIRDALLLVAIGGMMQESLATVAVLAYRILTIVGDIGFFGIATLVRLPASVQEPRPN
jgi:uncharacterized membrane protein YbhN (UPF0104 family)